VQRRIRVLVADDHPVYRRGLARIVERSAGLELAGEAGDGRSALGEIRALRPDVVLLDVEMPGLDGLAVLRALQRDGPGVRVLVVSGSVDSDVVYEAIELGAAGFLSKDEDERAITDAIAAVARGETVLGPTIQAAIARGVRARAAHRPGSELTERELQVLRLTARGLSSLDIGRELHLSPATVKTHLGRIYSKLGVADRAAAVAAGMRFGLLD
jgi:two-component system, NarL family, nitrate/nitrite response regulator NarL